jgi:hypothetical protein
MNNKESKRDILRDEIDIIGAKTTPLELIKETLINFFWGFMGNSIVVFMAKGIDAMVFLNFILYYILISYIVNRDKYKTRLGKFIILPGSAALGAYAGYKVAQIISNLL